MAAIVTFIGWHDSGKTTLATRVVAHLKQFGYTVAVIKSSSEAGVAFDTPGTDTYQHRQAGADGILFVGPDQTVLQTRSSDLSIAALSQRYFPDVDIVIGEGFKEAKRVPKIEVVRSPEQNLRHEVTGVIAVATDLDIAGDSVFGLDQAREIATFIRDRFLGDEVRRSDSVQLLINGKNVPMKSFVQDALAGTVIGFVKSLKFTDDSSEIELRIKLDDRSDKDK